MERINEKDQYENIDEDTNNKSLNKIIDKITEQEHGTKLLKVLKFLLKLLKFPTPFHICWILGLSEFDNI